MVALMGLGQMGTINMAIVQFLALCFIVDLIYGAIDQLLARLMAVTIGMSIKGNRWGIVENIALIIGIIYWFADGLRRGVAIGPAAIVALVTAVGFAVGLYAGILLSRR